MPITNTIYVPPFNNTTDTAVQYDSRNGVDGQSVTTILFDNPSDLECVMVTWVDSVQPDSHWQFLSNMPKADLPVCQTLGWVVDETPDSLMVAQTVSAEDDGDHAAIGLVRIPKAAIKSRQILISGRTPGAD